MIAAKTADRPRPRLSGMQTLTPAEVAGALGVSANRVRQLLRDRKLMAVPGSGGSKIPADFLQDGTVQPMTADEFKAAPKAK